MRLVLISFIILLFCFAGAQDVRYTQDQPLFSDVDAAWLEQLPEAKLPHFLRSVVLPDQIDNSSLPYFRPIFSQDQASCGQAAGVGYAFTYEINRLRGLPADTSINQYPSHFTYNFMNGGTGYYGVNYMHSFDILKKLGTPTVYDYGGMSIDDGSIWASGYDLYRAAMQNRVREVRKIKVGTPEGLNTLKHWLVNHLSDAETGGVALFNSGSPWNYQALPPESPEAGKKVIVQYPGTYATHAMTIVGYNDSIRFDINGDGQFTNHIDINGDGVVDMKDWEIGAVKFANSYGVNWADSGYCYMMYKTLADDVVDGGIWNNTVNILDVKADYEPLLTMKLTLKHDSREKIRIAAGISQDTSALKPERLLFFPMFNYQGGHQYMQGGRSDDSKKTIEIGLDLTPLLSYLAPGDHAKFFVEVHENDPKNEGAGEIVSFALRDYTAGMIEISSPIENIPIANNQITRAGIVHQLIFDKAAITTEELPPVFSGFPFSYQMEASGGAPDYRWQLATVYHRQKFHADFPVINQQQLIPEAPHNKLAPVQLEFDFPFYDEVYNEIFVHRDGYILFENDIFPWPYYNDAYLLFRQMKTIAVLLFNPVKYYPGTHRSEGMWFEGNESYAAIRWTKALSHYNNHIGMAEFAVKLFSDGSIEFYYNDIQLDEDILWYAGVSSGFDTEHTLIATANTTQLPRYPAYSLIPELIPFNFSVSSEGLLTGAPQPDEQIYNLTFNLLDDKEVMTTKTLQLSDGLIFSYDLPYVIQSGDLVKVNMTVKNIYPQSYSNVQATLLSKDPFLEIHVGQALFGDIQPGETITVSDAFEVTVWEQTPDSYTFLPELVLYADEAEWNGRMAFTSSAPFLLMHNYSVSDDNNQLLDPGETAEIEVAILNDGHATAQDVTGTLASDDPYITINTPSALEYGELAAGEKGVRSFSVSVDGACPLTHRAEFQFHIQAANGIEITETFTLTIGQIPLLVINKAQNGQSVEVIKNTLDALGMEYDYLDSIPPEPEHYQAIMLSLGTFYVNTALTAAEGLLLAGYLDQGGKLYMEGTTTWYVDPQTNVHPKFHANVQTLSNWQIFNSLHGVEGSFAEDWSADFSGSYNLLPCYFLPEAPGFAVLKTDTGDDVFTMAAYFNGVYKTIASILEFGSFGEAGDLEQRKELMTGILDFFDLKDYITKVDDRLTQDEDRLSVSAYPNPFGGQVNFDITLGAPADVAVRVYDLSGQLVWQSHSGGASPEQNYSISWDVAGQLRKSVPPGIYIYSVTAASTTFTGKLVKIE